MKAVHALAIAALMMGVQASVWAPDSRANTEELVASTVQGGSPYMLVFEDRQGFSNKAPGIYVRVGSAGEWEIAVPGAVMSVPIRGGLSHQLGMARVTNRFESLSVVDGRLCLFTAKTRPFDATSFGIFGRGAFAVLDPIDGSTIELPLLRDLNDISLYSKEEIIGGVPHEVVIVSIKHPVPKGDGITFAFVLNARDSASSEVKPVYQPVLLDYKFTQSQNLNELVLPRASGFVSLNVAKAYSRPHLNDPAPVRDWRSLLNSIATGTRTIGSLMLSERESFPFLGLLTGVLEIESLPYLFLQRNSFSAIAVFDPIARRGGVYVDFDGVSSQEMETAQPLISGIVNCDANGCVDVSNISLGERLLSMLRMRDGRLFAIAKTDPMDLIDSILIRPTDTDFLGKVPDQISWVGVPQTKLILVSWKFGAGALTAVYEIDTASNSLRIKHAVSIDNSFYSAEELYQRVSHKGTLALFDGFTPRVALETYGQVHRDTAPHVNLTATVADERQQFFYPRSLQARVIATSVTYHTYDTPAGFNSQTGLYAGDAGGQSLALGELLQPSGLTSKGGDLDAMKVRHPLLGPIELQFLAFDPGNKGGAQSFQVLALLHRESATQIPTVQYVARSANPVSELKYFQLIRVKAPVAGDAETVSQNARDGASQNYLAVMAFEKGPTTAIGFEIGRNADGNPLFTDKFERSVSQSFVPLQEVHARLRFEEESGAAYWVDTPELDDAELGFSLTRISDGMRIEPNRASYRFKFRGVASPADSQVSRYPAGWRIYAGEKKYSELVSRLRHASEYQTDVFPRFRELLDDLANPRRPARRVVLIVPAELKSYCENYPLALRARENNRPAHWAENNQDSPLYMLDPLRADQEQVISNLTAMREQSRGSTITRAVLYSSLANVKQVDRPKLTVHAARVVGFSLSERRLGATSVSVQNGEETSHAEIEKQLPGLPYLVATEGQRIDLSTFQTQPPEPTFSSLFIGTEEEWASVMASSTLEQRYGLSDRFETVRLEPPTREIREDYVLNLLRRAEIVNLGYGVSLANLVQGSTDQSTTQENAERQIASYLVNRAESLANRNHMPVFDGFMKVLNLLGYELTNNARLRSRRTIDRSVVENVLARVFSMPLNINLLPPDDPLQILHRHEPGQEPGEEAAFQWVQAGYYGPLSLKMEIIQTILNQLTNDEVRSVASAMIVYGDTGSGKTSLILTLFQILGLKQYKFNATAEVNADAWAFFMPMGKVFDDGPAATAAPRSTGMIPMSEALAHLDRFLAGPNGYRGFLCLDDIHLATPTVRARFLAKIRSLIENPTYTATSADGRVVEYPTRNLTPILTMNPTDNRERIAKFASKGKDPTDTEIILATLSNGDGSNDIERSFLARFGRIINLSQFPAEAKAPKLAHTTRQALQDILENDNKYAVVSPSAIQTLVTRFPQVDARTFISAATRSLTQQIKNFPGGMFAVVPYRVSDLTQNSQAASTSGFEASGAPVTADIEAFARTHIQVIPIEGESSYRGKLEFLKYVLDNFRKHSFELLLLGLNHDPRFSKGAQMQQYLAAPLAQALFRHVMTVPALPLEQLNLEARDFGAAHSNERLAFRRTLNAELLEQQLKQDRLPSVGTPQTSNLYQIYAGTGLAGGATRTRQHVLRDLVDRLTGILEQTLKESLHVTDLAQFPDSETWLRQMTAQDPRLVERFGSALMEQLAQYLRDINNRALPENRDQSDARRLSQYDAMRLFIMAFDRAISRLPWSRASNFMVDSISRATQNTALGQSPGVQHFLFTSKTSPVISTDSSLVLMLAQSVPFFSDQSEEAQHTRFMSNCERLLGGGSSP